MSLAAAKKSLANDNKTNQQPGKPHGTQSPHVYDSEDTSLGPQTPGASTPVRISNNGTETAPHKNGTLNPINNLGMEFEQRKQNFDIEAQSITEVKSGSANPAEDVRRLKHRFEAWKKDFKLRLRETKAKAQRMGHSEAEKHRRKWWGKKAKKILVSV